MQDTDYKSRKYKIYPTAEQKDQLEKEFGTNRFVWNSLHRWFTTKCIILKYETFNDQLFDLKQMEENAFLKQANQQTLQHTLKTIVAAFEDFASGKKKFPKLKRKFGEQSIKIPQNFSISDREIRISKFKDPIRKRHQERTYFGAPISITISKEKGQYFASVLYGGSSDKQ